MSTWKNQRWGIRKNQQIDDLLDEEFIDYLEREFDGPTDFFEKALRREKKQSKSLSQKIEEKEEKLEGLYEELQELKDKQEEQEQEKKLRRKKDELRELQKEYKRVKRSGLTSREDAEEKVLSGYRNRVGYQDLSDEEIKEEIDFDRLVEKKLVDSEEISELAERISSLQSDIQELNGGERYDWWIMPEEEEVEA